MNEPRKHVVGRSQEVLADRRRHRRFVDSVKVRFRDLEGTQPAAWAKTRDLSLGGLCLLTAMPIELNRHLALEIHMEDATAPVLVLGRVLRSELVTVDESEVAASGLEFLWVSAEDRSALQHLADCFRERYGESGGTDTGD